MDQTKKNEEAAKTERAERLLDKKIGPTEKNRWRHVKVDAVVKAANACCPGIDFAGSSKSDIFESFNRTVTDDAKGISRTGMTNNWKCELFRETMHELARLERRLNDERKNAINVVIDVARQKARKQ